MVHGWAQIHIHGQPQGLSLRYDIEFNLIAAVNNYVFVSFLGGSKPPPYAVGRTFTFTDNRNDFV